MNDAPVGVFDSGVGGLSVLREIRQQLPNESLLYVADSGYVPYGEKSPEQIRQRSRAIADFLLGQGAKTLVVACNTATAAAVNDLRSLYDLPIIGMEPAVKPAALATRSGIVGVLATTGTLQSAKFAALLDRFAGSVKVITQPCPGLVELIEQGELQGPRIEALLRGFTAPLLAAGCDTLILGCTHYPFIRGVLQHLLPAEVNLIDTGAAVARHLHGRLADANLLAAGPSVAERFWTSGNVKQMRNVLPVLWGHDAKVEWLPV
ncbi:MAG: glutamate racemase [Pseudomonas sp.]|jgi:glutamate racemase|uniref:glutamate racemase n=1 Tax=Halopseudomonas TaxID=2901189 RepID=UPI001B5C5398|nr:glutamate racemase [Pseudomonas sp.]MBQ0778963.1 glutamate racemase [Pseudomonas sp.]WOD10772.1 glutamate racemase [Pseudomonas sp. NyZ704]|tara:strand:- start:250 stop:1038 length:789 start_codon:yes stop_codon:yes gene_type:complete